MKSPGEINIKAIKCDVTSVESVEASMNTVVETYGGIDLLWNNAGYQGQIKPTLEYDPVDFANVMSINVTGMFIVMQSAAKRMVHASKEKDSSQNKFSIVNTASVAGLRGTPAMIAYSSSKAAVLAMTVSSAKVRRKSTSTSMKVLSFDANDLIWEFLLLFKCHMDPRILHPTGYE